MADFFGPTMRLYMDKLIDWPTYFELRGQGDADVETEVGAYRTILETSASLAEGFQPTAREHWEAPAELTPDGGATSPPHIRAAYDTLREAGLVSLSVSEAYGGYGLPALLNGMYMEMISRADPSLMMVVGLQSGAANDVERYGSEAVKREWLPKFASGEVEGCMDLTEPQAGSDLGGITTRATDRDDGSVQIDGQKIYISNGGAEVHLVLARDTDTFEDSKGTTSGLSLVLVSRHREDGSANGVRVARLERKIGIHGSATCEVIFEGAIGIRLGEKSQGFRAMLDLMNNARLGVASQALGLCDAAIHDALTYARQREQFGKPISQQPLVQEMLARMVVQSEGARALLYRTYGLLDGVLAREVALARNDLPEVERVRIQEEYERDTTRVRLLTPLCKYVATEICSTVTRDAIQVFGGVGYTMDSDAGKLHNDSLIMTIYEGTSEIQASFALREMGKGALGVVFKEVRSELEAMEGEEARGPLAKLVLDATVRIEDTLKVLFSNIEYALLRSKALAAMVIHVISSAELLKQAAVDPSRMDLAESYVRRQMLAVAHNARRIEENMEDRVKRSARVLSTVETS